MQWTYDAHYASLAEFAAVKPSKANAAAYAEDQAAYNPGWYGVATSADVRRTVSQGWPEGVQRTFEALRGLEVRRAVSIKRRRVRGDFGDAVDMQRVYRGDLANAWERMAKREGVASPVVTIYVDVGVRAEMRQEQLFWRGAAALIVIDALQTAGYSVEVIAGMTGEYMHSKARGQTMRQTVTVKAASAPLDLNALASCLCLIGFHRVFGFAARLSIPINTNHHYGQSTGWIMPNAIAGLTDCTSQQAAQAWIESTLKPYSGQPA